MYVRLVDLRIAKDLFDGLKSAAEQVLAELLEAGTGKGSVEVNAFKQRVDFDRRLCGGRKSSLSALARCSETSECPRVRRKICNSLRQRERPIK
jgi:hypothetical protein